MFVRFESIPAVAIPPVIDRARAALASLSTTIALVMPARKRASTRPVVKRARPRKVMIRSGPAQGALRITCIAATRPTGGNGSALYSQDIEPIREAMDYGSQFQ